MVKKKIKNVAMVLYISLSVFCLAGSVSILVYLSGRMCIFMVENLLFWVLILPVEIERNTLEWSPCKSYNGIRFDISFISTGRDDP